MSVIRDDELVLADISDAVASVVEDSSPVDVDVL